MTRALPIGGQQGLVQLIQPDDYPRDALQKGKQGRVRIRLDVDPRGFVSKCTVLESAGTQSLDDAACSLLQARARFTPGPRLPRPGRGRRRDDQRHLAAARG